MRIPSARAAWIRSTSTPSWFDWALSIATPSSAPSAASAASISASVVLPYTSGSRVPRRLRFGPWSTRIRTRFSEWGESLSPGEQGAEPLRQGRRRLRRGGRAPAIPGDHLRLGRRRALRGVELGFERVSSREPAHLLSSTFSASYVSVYAAD